MLVACVLALRSVCLQQLDLHKSDIILLLSPQGRFVDLINWTGGTKAVAPGMSYKPTTLCVCVCG